MNSFIHLIHRTGQSADHLVSDHLKHSELTSRQLIVLEAVATARAVSQTDIVATTGIDRSTIADIVRRLVERNLLARERTRHDARMYAVKLTSEGRRVWDAAQEVQGKCEAQLLEVVAPKDREAFVRSLTAIVENFGPINSARVSSRQRQQQS